MVPNLKFSSKEGLLISWMFPTTTMFSFTIVGEESLWKVMSPHFDHV